MKKILLQVFILTSTTIAFGQIKQGFNLTLREDLVDFSIKSVEGNTLNPYGTAYRHTFGTELSAGYYMGIGDQWEFGISTGLMLHDYSLTSIFRSWEEPTNTSDNGVFTHTERQTYKNQTTLSLPIVTSAKYIFNDWAERQLWNIAPLISARLGYVVSLTGVDGEYYEEVTVNPVPNPYGMEPCTEYTWRTSSFIRRGFIWSFGIGARCGLFDLELEYIFQPKRYISDSRQESVDGNGVLRGSSSTHNDYNRDNSDGLALRITFRF